MCSNLVELFEKQMANPKAHFNASSHWFPNTSELASPPAVPLAVPFAAPLAEALVDTAHNRRYMARGWGTM